MTKNNKGFFLAETVIVISLITTVMVFVFPNLSKLYDNFKNRSEIYDQIEDLYALRAIYDKAKEEGTDLCKDDIRDDLSPVNSLIPSGIGASSLYLTKYISSPSSSDYNFNKYLHRMKKTSNDTEACRLIGVFEHKNDDEEVTKTTYASIKIYPLVKTGGEE